MKRCFLFLLSACLLLPSARAQLRFESFSVEKGMSAGTVLDLLQTHDGFMWIATADGLNRFDGVNFSVYRKRPGESGGLPDNYITALAEDAAHRLWIGCNDGSITILDPRRNTFTPYAHLAAVNPNKLPVLSLQTDNRGALICILQQGGAWLLGGADDKQAPRRLLQEDGFEPVCMATGADGQWWFGGVGGVRIVNPANPGGPAHLLLREESVNALVWTGNHYIAATQGNGLWSLETNGNAIPIQAASRRELLSNIVALHVDTRGYLWCANNYFDGLVRLQLKGGSVVQADHCMHDPFNRESLINNSVLTLCGDAEGNVWAGTLSGMSVFKPLNQQFAVYRHIPGAANTLSGANTYALFEDFDGSIWSGSLDAGINCIRPDGSVETYTAANTSGLPTPSVRCIFRDRKGRYWVGAGNEGLFRFEPKARRFSKVIAADADGTPLDQLQVKSMTEDESGNLWLGTTASLWKYFPETGKAQRFAIMQESLRKFPNLPDFQVIEVRRDAMRREIICATFGQGLLIMKEDGAALVNHLAKPGNRQSLNTNNLMGVTFLGRDTLLIGTYGGGLNIFDRRSGLFSALTTENGLPNDVVYGVLPVRDGSWWMSTNRGLVNYQPRTRRFRHLDQLTQVQSLEFNEGTYLAARDGSLWFGGVAGINRFRPDQLETNKVPPSVAITRMRVLERPWPFDSFYHAGSPLVLNHRQNFFRLDFSALSFTNPDKNRYRYKLEGFDENWIDAGNVGSAAYTNVPPGEYIFRVIACNDDGEWSPEGASLQIHILPPFWRTWWFMGGAVLASGLLLLLVYRLRTASLRRRFQLTLAESELRALRGQMNPHFIFNSINSIQYYVLNKSPGEAYGYLAKFSSLMRMILQNSRLSVIPFEQELQALRTYLELEQLRLDGALEYEIQADPSIDPKEDRIPSMLIQPYVENAILHGLAPRPSERRLKVMFRKLQSHLFVVVEDNGIGRQASMELNRQRASRHQSTAMSVTRQRLEMLNRRFRGKLSVQITDLKDSMGEAAGTRVEIFIPVNPFEEHEGADR